jgi:hypothetical protein
MRKAAFFGHQLRFNTAVMPEMAAFFHAELRLPVYYW